MAWSDWSNWDSAGQVGGVLGQRLENAASFFQRTSEQLMRQASTSASRAEMYRAAWQTLDGLTTAALHDLNAIAPGALDVQIAGRVQALKVELSKADAFIRSAAQNAFAANQIEALGKNLGAIIGAAELLYKMKGDNFSVYDFGETGLGLVGASIGVGLATLIGAPVAATVTVGILAGFASKWLWEKK